MTGGTGYQAPNGPHWIKNARLLSSTQVDGRGVIWTCTDVRQGGRVLRWTNAEGLLAVTVCTESHPDYPTDAAVVAWEREQKRAAREAARRGWYP